MSKHIRRTCLRSVALKAEDTALIWMLTSAKNKKSLVNVKCYRKEIMSSYGVPKAKKNTYNSLYVPFYFIWDYYVFFML